MVAKSTHSYKRYIMDQGVENSTLLQHTQTSTQVLWFLTTLQVNDLQERALHSAHDGGLSQPKRSQASGANYQRGKERAELRPIKCVYTHAGLDISYP